MGIIIGFYQSKNSTLGQILRIGSVSAVGLRENGS